MKTKRAVLVKPGLFEIVQEDIFPADNEVLVKVAACGLCNWELNHWKGIIGECPQTLGHEWSGVVVDTGKSVTKIKSGDTITIIPDRLAGFAEYAVVQEENCYVLDGSVNLQHALGEPLKCVMTVLGATGVKAGDYGVIMGCGPMGLWCIQALSGHMLSALIAIDTNDYRLELAKKYGATHTINPKKENAVKYVEELTKGRMADFLIEGTGSPVVLESGIDYLKQGGNAHLVVMSSHEEPCREFDFRKALAKGISMHFAFPSYSASHEDDMRRAAAFINNGVFHSEDIITHRFKLEDINSAFKALESKPEGYIKGIVIPD